MLNRVKHLIESSLNTLRFFPSVRMTALFSAYTRKCYARSHHAAARRASLPRRAVVLLAGAFQLPGMRYSGRAYASEPLTGLYFYGLEPVPGLGALRLEPGRRGKPAPRTGRLVAADPAGRVVAAVLPQRGVPRHRLHTPAAPRAHPALV